MKNIIAFTLISKLLTNPQHACALILPLATAHSGLPGGGLGFSGNIFRVPFFGFFWLPYMPNDQEKVFKHQGEPFSCVDNGAEMGLDLQFPLYFALLHKISSASYCPPPKGILLILSDS